MFLVFSILGGVVINALSPQPPAITLPLVGLWTAFVWVLLQEVWFRRLKKGLASDPNRKVLTSHASEKRTALFVAILFYFAYESDALEFFEADSVSDQTYTIYHDYFVWTSAFGIPFLFVPEKIKRTLVERFVDGLLRLSP